MECRQRVEAVLTSLTQLEPDRVALIIHEVCEEDQDFPKYLELEKTWSDNVHVLVAKEGGRFIREFAVNGTIVVALDAEDPNPRTLKTLDVYMKYLRPSLDLVRSM